MLDWSPSRKTIKKDLAAPSYFQKRVRRGGGDKVIFLCGMGYYYHVYCLKKRYRNKRSHDI